MSLIWRHRERERERAAFECALKSPQKGLLPFPKHPGFRQARRRPINWAQSQRLPLPFRCCDDGSQPEASDFCNMNEGDEKCVESLKVLDDDREKNLSPQWAPHLPCLTRWIVVILTRVLNPGRLCHVDHVLLASHSINAGLFWTFPFKSASIGKESEATSSQVGFLLALPCGKRDLLVMVYVKWVKSLAANETIHVCVVIKDRYGQQLISSSRVKL